jgi:hypothetical protein
MPGQQPPSTRVRVNRAPERGRYARATIDAISTARDPVSGEVTIDYRVNASRGDRWPCSCGAESRLGYVEGGFFSLDDSRPRGYVAYAPAFIRREYRRRTRRSNAR